MSKRIAVIGCGWLGIPLAKKLTADGLDVFGTTTSKSKLPKLSEFGIRPVLLDLGPESVKSNDIGIWESDAFIVAIPPGVRRNGPDYHVKQIEALIRHIPSHAHIIYISSTSVYPSSAGVYDESYTIDIMNTGNTTLLRSENLVRSRVKSSILRCGGLMGENRVSGSYFAGKEVGGEQQPVNYIHQIDAVEIIHDVMFQHITGLYNLVCPGHPTRAEVYKANSDKFGFEMPSFKDDGVERIIDGTLIADKLDFEFSYPDPQYFHG